jgi:hypothetical protein
MSPARACGTAQVQLTQCRCAQRSRCDLLGRTLEANASAALREALRPFDEPRLATTRQSGASIPLEAFVPSIIGQFRQTRCRASR